jgi:hypothetical protein
VQRLLPHHHYVCTRHRYWIGPPDAGQPATPLEDDTDLQDVVRAQHRHGRLLRRYGAAVIFDAVLTGFLICGHIWDSPVNGGWAETIYRWTRRCHALIPVGLEPEEFSAARLFAAIYPDAVEVAHLIGSPAWRRLAASNPDNQQQFIGEIGRRLGRADYRAPQNGDAITHWMKYDSWQTPSRPKTSFPDSRDYGSGRPARTSAHSLDRTRRGALWFAVNRRGGNVILHHRHIRPVLVRDWSRPMDGITATIWASQATDHPVENRGYPDPRTIDRQVVTQSGQIRTSTL